MTHQRYGIFFAVVAGVAFLWAIATVFPVVCVLLIWLGISCVLTAAAFFAHRPEWLMGKKQNGSVCWLNCLLNSPFLLIYWFVWAIRHFVFRHEALNTVAGTNVSISCWPGFHVPLDRFDMIIDVTSEMPKLYRCPKTRYLCLPNLDGVPLDHFELPVEIRRDMRILVHCAQGRGRSALMTCLILLKFGHAQTGEEAFTMLKQSRPSVVLSGRQFAQLCRFSPSSIF